MGGVLATPLSSAAAGRPKSAAVSTAAPHNSERLGIAAAPQWHHRTTFRAAAAPL
jgi:hypothetical protein